MAAFRKYTHEEMVKEEEGINFLVRIFSMACFPPWLFHLSIAAWGSEDPCKRSQGSSRHRQLCFQHPKRGFD